MELTTATSNLRHVTVCPACGVSRDFQPLYMSLDRCRGCGFVLFRDTGAVDFRALYGEGYFSGFEYADYLGQQGALRRSMRRHLAQMARYQQLRGSLFEIGCAYGLFLDEARRHFDGVAGVDVSPEATAYARDTLGLEVSDSNFLEMDLGGRRFDAVCMWDTVEHLPTPDRFVRKASELLSDEGLLYLTTGDIGSLNARIRGSNWRQIHPPSHVGYFSRPTISLMLSRVGLEVVGIGTAAYYHTPFNILRTLELRGDRAAKVAGIALKALGQERAKRVGFWIDLRDIMFVAARRVRT